jgi:hypothetical protein
MPREFLQGPQWGAGIGEPGKRGHSQCVKIDPARLGNDWHTRRFKVFVQHGRDGRHFRHVREQRRGRVKRCRPFT